MDDRIEAKRSVTYVTDLSRTLSGGGAYAVNWHAFDELAKRFNAHYAGPIVPKPPFVERNVSKVRRRILKVPGRYSYFSGPTLNRNARIAANLVAPGSDAIVFRSAGRWSRCRPAVPYFVYLDAAVHTFFHNTFEPSDFESADLERIWREEALFLENASGVYFESDWGLRMAKSAYGLKRDHYRVAGRGGVLDPPLSDTWDGKSQRLVTIAMDFRQKGGDIVAEAYKRLKPRFPSLTWSIIGGEPDKGVAELDGVSYAGVLRADEPSERARLAEILSGAFLCVHPTREDTSPLVITEAAYFGCPSVSVRLFAIPDLVLDGRTGILLDAPADPAQLASAIESLLLDRPRYLEMRRGARDHALNNFQWERVGSVICDGIEEVLRG